MEFYAQEVITQQTGGREGAGDALYMSSNSKPNATPP